MDGDVPGPSNCRAADCDLKVDCWRTIAGDWLGRMIAKFLVVGGSGCTICKSALQLSHCFWPQSRLNIPFVRCGPRRVALLSSRVAHTRPSWCIRAHRDPSLRQSATSGDSQIAWACPKAGSATLCFWCESHLRGLGNDGWRGW